MNARNKMQFPMICIVVVNQLEKKTKACIAHRQTAVDIQGFQIAKEMEKLE